MTGFSRHAVAGVAALLMAMPASAQTLKFGMGPPVISIDPHFMDSAPNKGVVADIFDALTDLDPTAHLIPSLATSWKLLDDHTWQFQLRPGVKFQDGQDFTAQDVAFSLARVPQVVNSPSPFTSYTHSIDNVKIVDDHTIELHTKDIDPLLPVYLAQVRMVSHGIGSADTTADFDHGKAAIGTGPFRLVSYTPSVGVELERNPDYWDRKPDWQHVSIRFIPDNAARVAALLAGDVQAIDVVPTADLPQLRKRPEISVADAVGLRLIYLTLDQGRTGPSPFVTGPNGEALTTNPLRDLRVRQALSMAIDRKAIVHFVMDDAALPSQQFLPPGSVSYVDGLNPPPYDPARAKQLLAEAGYPNGFRVTLNGPIARYVNDTAILQAIGTRWQRIGVQTSVQPVPWSSFAGKAHNGDYSVTLAGVGSPTGDDSLALTVAVATSDPAHGLGVLNTGHYSNQQVDQLLAQAMGTVDDARRNALLEQATATAMNDVAIIPLHIQDNIWATRKGVTYTARRDEQTRVGDIRATP
jgi:peptide/nickel transport system substrate-binding protein